MQVSSKHILTSFHKFAVVMTKLSACEVVKQNLAQSKLPKPVCSTICQAIPFRNSCFQCMLGIINPYLTHDNPIKALRWCCFCLWRQEYDHTKFNASSYGSCLRRSIWIAGRANDLHLEAASLIGRVLPGRSMQTGIQQLRCSWQLRCGYSIVTSVCKNIRSCRFEIIERFETDVEWRCDWCLVERQSTKSITHMPI